MKKPQRLKGLFSFPACLWLLLAFSVGSWAQQFPLDEKSRYETELEKKLNESILNIIGPNKARVMINAQMDFSKTEKMNVQNPPGSRKQADTSILAQEAFRRLGEAGGDVIAKALEPIEEDTQDKSQPSSYAKQLIYPPSFVKKLAVTLVINKDLPDDEADGVKFFVSGIMNLDPARGDELIIVRTPFAPFWKTVWFSPEALPIVFKYGMLSLVIIVSVLAILIALLKLSSSLTAISKSRRLDREPQEGMAQAAIGGSNSLPALKMDEKPADEAAKTADQPLVEGPAEVVFKVRADQVPALVHMMAKEKPENVSLIAGHLPSDIRSAFLKALPPDDSAEVIAHLSEFRFVKPEVLTALKEELERRFSGTVGGVDKVLEALDQISLKEKKGMLQRLEAVHPEVARKIRAGVVLFEDLVHLEPRDISTLSFAVNVEDWAAALVKMDEKFKRVLKAQMAEKTWRILEENIKYSAPSEEKAEKAVERIVETALKLIKEGRISSPLAGKQPPVFPSASASLGGPAPRSSSVSAGEQPLIPDKITGKDKV